MTRKRRAVTPEAELDQPQTTRPHQQISFTSNARRNDLQSYEATIDVERVLKRSLAFSADATVRRNVQNEMKDRYAAGVGTG